MHECGRVGQRGAWLAAGEDTSAALAAFVAESAGTEIPLAVRDSGGTALLDTVAAMLHTHAVQPQHARLIDLIRSWGGRATCVVVGTDLRTSEPSSALANSALARGANLDDCHDESGTHPSAVVVPAVMALAESRAARGDELLRAIAIGNEVLCRLGLGVASECGIPMQRWFPTTVFGIFGAAAGCCCLLGLDAEQTRHAFGIALAQASGTLEPFSPSGQKSAMRGMISGFAAQGAVQAAMMASLGVTGPADGIDGRFGLSASYFDGTIDQSRVLNGLGSEWAIAGIGLKPWPVVRYLNAYVDAMRQLANDSIFGPEDIARIEVHVSGYAHKFFEPGEMQRKPVNYDNAVHALPFLIGLMAIERTITPHSILANLDNPTIADLAGKVVPVEDPAFGSDNRPGPGKIAVHTRLGEVFERTVTHSLGDPHNPLGRDGLRAKFLAAAEGRRWGPRADDVFDELGAIAHCENVGPILAALTA
jgi:2-methylcitrate dehydratase PrpD